MLFALLSSMSLAASAAAATTIKVGATSSTSGGVFQFIPPSVNATNGTVITFQFSGAPGNHSVTQSTFSSPCAPETGGFDSGWVFVPSAQSNVPEWNLTITDDSKPLWFFCKQLLPSPHCKAGMVGAINAPVTGNTFAAFQTAAKNSTTSGQGVGFLVGIGASASADVGPIPSGVSTFGAPSPGADTAIGNATASGSASAGSTGSASGSAASPSSTTSGASHVAATFIFALFVAALGLAMA